MDITPETRPFYDLVQIRCSGIEPDPGTVGSGLLVGHGIILTALHVVAAKTQGLADRAEIKVYLWRTLRKGDPRVYAARVIWPLGPRKDLPDLAILAIDGDDAPKPGVPCTYCELPEKGFAADARGFPKAAAGVALMGGREEHRQFGSAGFSNESRNTFSFKSDAASADEGPDAWGGLSGGPLFNGPDLVGVMREVPRGFNGRDNLEAEVLPALLRNDMKLRTILKVTWPPPRPDPDADRLTQRELQRLTPFLYTLDRTTLVNAAVGQVAGHMGHRPVEILVTGRPADRGRDFFMRIWWEIQKSFDPTVVVAPDTALRAPEPIAWPGGENDPRTNLWALARESLRRLMCASGLAPDLSKLRTELEKTVQLPFLAITLGRPLRPDDLALLDDWRRVWRDLQRARQKDCFAGYALLYSASDQPPAELLLNQTGNPDLGQVVVTLDAIKKCQIATWESELLILEKDRPPGSLDEALHPVARKLWLMIEKRNIEQYRLEDVSDLLTGPPNWDRQVA
jgi:Trypsin-like peptidase domain